MKTLRKSRSSAALVLALAAGWLAAPMLTSTTFAATNAPAADANDTMTQFVQARAAMDQGDYQTAQRLYLQLKAAHPDDPYINGDLAELEAKMKNAPASPTPTSAAPASSAPAASVAGAPANTAPAATVSTNTSPNSPAASGNATSSAPAAAPTAAPATSAAQAALNVQAAIQSQHMAAVQDDMNKAQVAAANGNYDEARQRLEAAKAEVPPGIASADLLDNINRQTANTYFAQATAAYNARDNKNAAIDLKEYTDMVGSTDAAAQKLQDALTAAASDPTRQNINDISPGYMDMKKTIDDLLVRGKAQFLYGDLNGAEQSFSAVIRYEPSNYEATAWLDKISTFHYEHGEEIQKETRTTMLFDVEQNWARPDTYVRSATSIAGPTPPDPLMKRLKEIIFPQVNFVPTTLDQIATQLHDTSANFDPDNKAVNINVIPPDPANPVYPTVSVPALSELSLAKILDIICEKSGYSWKVEDGIVTIRFGGASGTYGSNDTRGFPMTVSTLTLILGYHSTGGDSASPFDTSGNSTSAAPPGGSMSASQIEDGLKVFFVKAGVLGDDAKLAFSSEGKIYVTAPPGSLDRLDDFMRSHFSQVRQVQVQARFLDVQQGKLQEFSARWNIANATHPNDFLQNFTQGNGINDSTLRTLGTAFPLGNSGAQPTLIQGLQTATGANTGSLTIPQQIPSLPNGINVGAGMADNFSGIIGVLDGYKINMVIDALDQQQGTDLMSAPSLTVLSTKTATITVAQKLSYPTDFSQITATVSQATGLTGGNGTSGGGGGGVAITAGTPSNFYTQNVGVTMRVQPTVEDDDSIDLNINPVVTEFEGFIEYGGTSIAIQSGITATVPSGFIQPIFDERSVETQVTIFDGATVVIGGLTRDEVKTINDKVPVLGDIPLLGRLFQSKGESTQKRNLMIFVSANLISPGGGLAKQNLANAPANSLYQDPIVISPARDEPRQPTAPTTNTP